MMYTIRLNEKEMSSLLSIIKADFEYAYNNGEDSDIEGMQEDIELLKSISYAFTNDDAKLKLQTIISGYERNLRGVS